MSVKRDILGRELHDNDLVVIKGSGGYESAAKPMEVGVFIGKSVRTMTATRTARDMFLIENPGSMEMDLKNAILKKIADEKAVTKAKQTQKNKQPANMVGTIYKMTKDREVFLYCGKKKVSVYKNGQLTYQDVGHLYLSGARFLRDDSAVPGFTFDTFVKKNEEGLSSWGGYHDIKIQKSVKNYEVVYHQVVVPDTFQIEGVHHWKEGKWNGYSSANTTNWIEHDDEYVIVVEPV